MSEDHKLARRVTLPTDIPIPPPDAPKPLYEEPTGNLVADVTNTIKNIGQVPCARNSLLSGIASGAGIGVIRGLSAGPLMAGNWGVATFMLISLGSWHLCQKQIADERRKVKMIVEQMPQRMAKQREEQDTKPTTSP